MWYIILYVDEIPKMLIGFQWIIAELNFWIPYWSILRADNRVHSRYLLFYQQKKNKYVRKYFVLLGKYIERKTFIQLFHIFDKNRHSEVIVWDFRMEFFVKCDDIWFSSILNMFQFLLKIISNYLVIFKVNGMYGIFSAKLCMHWTVRVSMLADLA